MSYTFVSKFYEFSTSFPKQSDKNANKSPKMSTEGALDSSEDLENLDSVPLVRMVDVQPIDKAVEDSEEILETCVIDDAQYECIVDDEESNIGSIVSVQSEEVVYDDGSMELIVPEVVEPPESPEDPETFQNQITQEDQSDDQFSTQPKEQNSWPTLEILPGGVIINRTSKNVNNNDNMESSGMLYACAKCSESFNNLYSLVQHVKTHKEEEKLLRIVPLKPNRTNYICQKPKVKRRMKSKTKGKKMPKNS